MIWITKDMPQGKIDAQLAKFHGDVPPGKRRPRFIVATTSAFGVGLTLNEAVLICLLEPDYRVAMELQTFARHNRLGNKNKKTFSVLLYAEGNEREEKIRAMNAVRKRIGNKALSGKA